MKAFVLSAGLGKRLRPLTHSVAKSSVPFLNLPLLSYGWFYLEQMGVSEFVLNSYLFPEQLKKDISFLKSSNQKTFLHIEKKLLDSGGGFYNVKKHFEKEKCFFYLNGDSLFFPSNLNLLKEFKEDFEKSDFQCSFFGTAKNLAGVSETGCLWIDRDFILRGIGSKKEMISQDCSFQKSKDLLSSSNKDVSRKDLRPIQFTGLALFRSEFLSSLGKDKPHIFLDVMKPLIKNGRYKVFVDEEGVLLEGGEVLSYLKATEFCLKSLFLESQSPEVKNILEKVFARFDPQDQIVGIQSGRELSLQRGVPILAPLSVKGLENLEAQGFVVLGSKASFFGKSFLKRSILGKDISWRGSLIDKMLIKSVV